MNKNWFTRKHQGEDIDPIYLSNMIKATEYFIGWFKGYFDTSYERMLKRMHHMACANGYKGCTGGKYNRQVDDGYRRFHAGILLKKEWYVGVSGYQAWWPKLGGPKWHRPTGTISHRIEGTDDGYKLYLPDAKLVPRYVHALGNLICGLRHEFDPVLLADYMPKSDTVTRKPTVRRPTAVRRPR